MLCWYSAIQVLSLYFPASLAVIFFVNDEFIGIEEPSLIMTILRYYRENRDAIASYASRHSVAINL